MLDLILSWLAKVLAAAIDLAVKTIMPVFGFDFTTFSNAFPFAATAYTIFQRVALAITLLVAVYHLFPFLMSWFGIRAEQLKSTPTRQIGQAVLAVIAIYYGNYIMSSIIEIAQLPFSALLNADAVDLNVNFELDIASSLSDIFYQQSILLYVILIVMIGWSLIKVILEAVERYIVLYVLVYLSPLAAASLASEETSGIYKKYFTMFISQCLLLLLNVWSLKMAISMFSNLSSHSSPILGLLMGYAFLRVAQKLDSYMNQLGLNAAITGAGLGNEMFATGALLMGKFSGIAGGMTAGRTAGSGGAGGGGGILGFTQKLTQMNGVYNPRSAAADIARAMGSGAVQSVKESVGVGLDAYANSTETGRSRVTSAIEKGKTHLKENGVASAKEHIQTNLEATDNVITRMGNKRRNEDIIDTVGHSQPVSDPNTSSPTTSSAPQPTDSDLNMIAVNAHTAGKVFDGFQENDYSVTEEKYVTPVLDGIGATKANPALAQFVNVGYGNVRAMNKEYTLNREGISASYVKDGREYSLNVVNSSQFNDLPRENQQAYQNFRSRSGQTYYYKLDDKKVESTSKKS